MRRTQRWWRFVRWAATLALPAIAAMPLPGQAFTPGTRVRIWLTDSKRPFVGTVDSVGNDTVHLRFENQPIRIQEGQVVYPAANVPLAKIAGAQISRGRRSRVGEGLVFGLAIGGGLGALMGYSSGNDAGSLVGLSRGDKAVALGVAMGALGAGIGAIAGSNSHTDVWEDVPRTTWHLTGLRTGSLGVGVSVRF